MHQNDRDAVDAGASRGFEIVAKLRLVQRTFDRAIRADALVRCDDTGVEHFRLDDAASEDVRTRLIADLELILEAARYDECGGVALALQQRIGGDGRAHLDRANALAGDRRIRANAEELPDAFQRRVVVGAGILDKTLRAGCGRSDRGRRRR